MKSQFIETIAIVFNLKRPDAGDRYEEYDEIETIEALKAEIEKSRFRVVLVEQGEDLARELLRVQPDFVFNLAEGIGGGRAREAQVPCILESLGLPYSGSDPVAMGITLDKYLTRLVLKSAGIPVPGMKMIGDDRDLAGARGLFRAKKTFIVKPRWEGSSRGIFLNSVVRSFRELEERVNAVRENYRQPALVEEFLEGDEITAGVCGNHPPYLLGMMKIVPRKKSREVFLYCLENKRDWRQKIKYEPEESIPGVVRDRVAAYALKAFRALELRDVARIDFRLGRDRVPRIIDVNPLPGLSPHYSDLPILCRLKGISYPELIRIVLSEALSRYGFSAGKSARG